MEIIKAFAALRKNAILLQNMNGQDRYYYAQDDFKKQLVNFLRLDISELNKKQLLQLCAWVSSHRPVPLHSFLITLSKASDKINTINGSYQHKIKNIDGIPYEYNAENNTLFFDNDWLLVETDKGGQEYVITVAGNTFYLDINLNKN